MTVSGDGGLDEDSRSRYLEMMEMVAVETPQICRNMDTNCGEGCRTAEENVMRTAAEMLKYDKEDVEIRDNGDGRRE